MPAILDERMPAIIEETVRPLMKAEIGVAVEKQVRPLVKEEVSNAIENQVRPLFEAQNRLIARGFADLKAVIKPPYVTRGEFEALKRKVEALRKELNARKQQVNHRYRREIAQGLKEVAAGKDTPIDDLLD